MPSFFPLPPPPNNHSHREFLLAQSRDLHSQAKGSFFSLQICLRRRKAHLCNSSLSCYNAFQDYYVSSLLCAWGNGMNSIGPSRDDPTLQLVGSGPVKFQGVWNGDSNMGKRSKNHAPYLLSPLHNTSFLEISADAEGRKENPTASPLPCLNLRLPSNPIMFL